MLDSFTTETFAGRVGETFRIRLDAATAIDATLAEATVLGGSITGGALPGGLGTRAQAFSLVFRVPPAVRLPQRIYPMTHDALGEFELFLVPLGPEPGGGATRYEAVFT